jgi:hypothetical protein
LKPTLPTVGDKYHTRDNTRVTEVIRSYFDKVTYRVTFIDGSLPPFEFTETLSEFRRLEKASMENGARFEAANS